MNESLEIGQTSREDLSNPENKTSFVSGPQSSGRQELRGSKRGQMTVFVIIAILIVVGIILFFILRGELGGGGDVPAELAPVYDFYLGCVEEDTKAALDLAGTQGGRVFMDDYVPGSEYAPFANQLNFLGFGVPYWYYVAGNGVIKENVPSKEDIERDVERYIEENLENCDLDVFYEQGFDIGLGEIERVDVSIGEGSVDVSVGADVSVAKEEVTAGKGAHKVSVNSKFGKFYGLAREIYDRQKNEAFFEEYAVDVLRLYAPVDGVEISCSGKIWKTPEVIEELKEGLEANIQTLKLDGSYYVLKDEERKYFVTAEGGGIDENVNLLYFKDWPTRVEVDGQGVDEQLMFAEPVGNQEGLGVMGFCYAPYHFVYDLSFPVMVQLFNNEEIFQFPVVVILDNNVPREIDFSGGLGGEFDYLSEEEFDLCAFNTKRVEVRLFDANLNRIDGDLGYECFDQRCSLGETDNGVLVTDAPACLNGFVHARAEGYADRKQLFSSNEERTADVILDREYDVEVEVKIGGSELGERTAIVSFVGQEGKRTVSAALPETSSVKLSEGSYEVRVYVYEDSQIKIPASTKTQCQDIPRSGLAGIFGATKEKCFDITIPETTIDYALAGGGIQQDFLLESDVSKGRVVVKVQSLPKPDSLEQLQFNFASFEEGFVELEFI
jgi:hypothetical protein